MRSVLEIVFVKEMSPLTVKATLKGKDVIRPLVRTLHFTVQEWGISNWPDEKTTPDAGVCVWQIYAYY